MSQYGETEEVGEIGALVFDIGHHSLRVGHAGDDTPKAEIPAQVGVSEDGNSEPGKTSPKFFIDTNDLSLARKNMNVITYMKSGMIEDWDLFEKVLDYTYDKIFKSESTYHPVLMSEAPWNDKSKREKLTEIMFEKYNIPSFYLSKSAVLAAFANGRHNALVVDSGATHTSAIPVVEGFVLKPAIIRTPLGGDFITMQCKKYLEETGIELTCPYQVASKEVVDEKTKPKWTKKANLPEVTPSWHNYMIKKVVQDFQMSVLQVSENSYDEQELGTIPPAHYEFPDGYNQEFGTERFRIPETLFNPSIMQRGGDSILGAASIVTTSINMCDMDIRSQLYSSVIITGGNACLQGFPERMNRDLSYRTPSSMRLKLVYCNRASERRIGSWIGGSILASLQSFHDLWISAQDYEERGQSIVDKKCP